MFVSLNFVYQPQLHLYSTTATEKLQPPSEGISLALREFGFFQHQIFEKPLSMTFIITLSINFDPDIPRTRHYLASAAVARGRNADPSGARFREELLFREERAGNAAGGGFDIDIRRIAHIDPYRSRTCIELHRP